MARAINNAMIRHPDAYVRAARRLYRRGMIGYRKVAAAMGVPWTTVRQWIDGTNRADCR